ncbi:MAG TPA: cytidylate kinase-like family protein [Bradyrhizobium sp.]|nr:cytidylate kinase-like family protein [Bradyrhizobium sp.]
MSGEDSLEQLTKLLKVRLVEWQMREKNEQPRPKPVVTITQEPGCGAEAIAERLCSELDLHLYDWELVEQIAKDEKVSAHLVSWLEKNPPTELADFLADLAPGYGLSSDRYIGSLRRILLAIAVTGNAVIVGRGSNFILPPDKKIGLCFVAPLDLRIKNVMKESGVTEEEARKHITKLEAEHRRLVKKHLQADIRDPIHYRLVINAALIKPDTIVQMVKTMIQAVQAEMESSHDPSGYR